jgi:pumilio family protein 6
VGVGLVKQQTTPSITIKEAMPGTKRKSGPEKDTNFKGEKKPKIHAAAKSKGIQKPTVVVPEESSESEYSGNHTSGGIPLQSELANILDGGPQGPSGRVESKHQGREETEPKVTDTLHPDRARAVFTNSKSARIFIGIP